MNNIRNSNNIQTLNMNTAMASGMRSYDHM